MIRQRAAAIDHAAASAQPAMAAARNRAVQQEQHGAGRL